MSALRKRIFVIVLIWGITPRLAAPQSCSNPANPWKWSVSGYAGDASTGAGNAPSFHSSLVQFTAQYGGPVFCDYTWTIDNPTSGYGHFSGDCVAPASPSCAPPPPATCPTCDHSNGAATVGSPINLTNGNTFIQQSDLALPGLGGGLSLVRTWNSVWPASQPVSPIGLFGPNWRSTYEERVYAGTGNYVNFMVYARADGAFWLFKTTATTGTYSLGAPADTVATLTSGTSYWTLTSASGEVRRFDNASGNLIAILDRNGNTTQLAYDGSSRLTTITDATSRHLTFSYPDGTSRLVSSVTSDVGLTLSYAYDSQGRLTQVTKPDLSTISFAYNSQSLITSVTDSQNKVIESHTYDSSGRGLTSARANGVDAVTVSYQ